MSSTVATGSAGPAASTTPPEAGPSPVTPWSSVVRLSLVLSTVVAIFVLAFAWPGITGEPRDLPVAVVGDDAQVAQVERALEQRQPGAFTFTPLDTREAAVDAIGEREVYGAIVLGREPEVLTASAAAPAVAQVLGQVASGLEDAAAQQTGGGGDPRADAAAPVTVATTDVVPFDEADPRGAGFGGALLPLVLGGMIAGIALTMSVDGVARRVGGLAVIAVVAGLLVTLVMHTWLDVLPGGFLATSGVFTLAVLAIGAPIAGFASIIGRAGIAIGPILFMLIGNPIGGGTSPKEFLPGPWGTIGQLLPPGAAGTLLRDVSYFPDASVTAPVLVLLGWAAAGLLMAALGHRLQQTAGRHAEVAGA